MVTDIQAKTTRITERLQQLPQVADVSPTLETVSLGITCYTPAAITIFVHSSGHL